MMPPGFELEHHWLPLCGLILEQLPCCPKHHSVAWVSFPEDAMYCFTQIGFVPSRLPPAQMFQRPGLNAWPCGKFIWAGSLCPQKVNRLFVDWSRAIKDNGQCQCHCRMQWIQATQSLVISDHLFPPLKKCYFFLLKIYLIFWLGNNLIWSKTQNSEGYVGEISLPPLVLITGSPAQPLSPNSHCCWSSRIFPEILCIYNKIWKYHNFYAAGSLSYPFLLRALPFNLFIIPLFIYWTPTVF